MHDIKSNVIMSEGLAAKQYSAGTRKTGGVDMSLYGTGAFFLSAGAFGSSATLDAKLQYSDTDVDGNYVDVPSDNAYGNSTAMTQKTAVGTAAFYINGPEKKFYRLHTVSAVAAVDYGVTFVGGRPKKGPVA